MTAKSVDAYLAGLEPNMRATVDALRAIIAASNPELTERIKWNAPSFALADDDRITLGIATKGAVRVVLHRGAAVKDAGDFRFDDPGGLAEWRTADRGVMTFANADEVEMRREALQSLFARWLEATA